MPAFGNASGTLSTYRRTSLEIPTKEPIDISYWTHYWVIELLVRLLDSKKMLKQLLSTPYRAVSTSRIHC